MSYVKIESLTLGSLWYLVFYTYNLEVRNADIEALIHIGMPHNPNIGDEESAKITLKERKPTSEELVQSSNSHLYSLLFITNLININ